LEPFGVHIDANNFTVGGVLMQDGHMIAFESKKLVGFNYDGQLMKKNCTQLCDA
jgi:hypothetical protein